MIRTKTDLKRYIEDDMKLVKSSNKPKIFGDECHKYLVVLRKLEYRMNKTHKNPIDKIMYAYYKLVHHRQSVRWGILIPPNVFGSGLTLFHVGTIIVNNTARVGENCHLYNCVNIAQDCKIGKNSYIAPGAKVLPGVELADNIRIGANAVVTKSFLEPGITIAGVPAVKISDKGSTHACEEE